MAKVVNVILIDGSMFLYDPLVINSDSSLAVLYSTVFAQAASRAKSSDANVTNDSYFSNLLTQYHQLGWSAVNQGQQTNTTSGQKVVMIDYLIATQSYPNLTFSFQKQVHNLAGQANTDNDLKNALDWWWQKCKSDLNNISFGIGAITSVDNVTNISCNYYSFDPSKVKLKGLLDSYQFNADTWASLFKEYSSSTITPETRTMSVNLYKKTYDTNKANLASRLDPKLNEHYRAVEVPAL